MATNRAEERDECRHRCRKCDRRFDHVHRQRCTRSRVLAHGVYVPCLSCVMIRLLTRGSAAKSGPRIWKWLLDAWDETNCVKDKVSGLSLRSVLSLCSEFTASSGNRTHLPLVRRCTRGPGAGPGRRPEDQVSRECGERDDEQD